MYELAKHKDGRERIVESRGPAGGLFVKPEPDEGQAPLYWADGDIDSVMTVVEPDVMGHTVLLVDVPKVEFVKHDAEKPRVDLLPVSGVLEAARAMGHGATKYPEDNWKRADEAGTRRYIAAAIRHLLAVLDGEVTDQDSGLAHLGHAAADCMIAHALVARKEKP